MLMKWLIRLAFPALGLLLLLMFFGLGDPAQAPQPSAELELQEIPSFEGLIPSPIPTEGPDIVFKWQDNDGNWHYADQPPARGPWNTLAIERPDPGARNNRPADPETDWQSPYSAPFSMEPSTANNGS